MFGDLRRLGGLLPPRFGFGQGTLGSGIERRAGFGFSVCHNAYLSRMAGVSTLAAGVWC